MASDPNLEDLDIICVWFNSLIEESMEKLVELQEINRAIDKILLIGARLSEGKPCIQE